MSRKAKPAGSETQLLGDKAAARAVLSARQAFNEALALRSLRAIETCLSEDVILVPGDDAQLIQGRKAQLEAWQGIFEQMPDVAYLRSPARIEIGECGGLAAETGRWTGSWSMDGMQIRYAGRYFAKWRFDGLAWLIEAETFVTMKRTGGAL